MRLGFIGYGNLAKAVYLGLKDEKGIGFSYLDRTKKDVDIHFCGSLDELALNSDIIWLTIKPQDLTSVLEELKSVDIDGKIIVSPVAGKCISFIEKFLGHNQHIIRIMPNLAMAYKASVTAFYTNHPEKDDGHKLFDLLEKLGKVVKIEESEFDLFTSVFGSGPAFILAFIQIFKNKMSEFNLPGSLPDELLLELTKGTTLYFMQNQKDYSIEELINNITSEGGTTQAGLDYFRNNEIDKHLEEVLNAAQNRSEELSKNSI